MPLDRTLYEIINDLRPLWTRGQIQGHLGRFGYLGRRGAAARRTLCLVASGRGSRLAMIMLSGANLLIFDEPTNHLDVESIEALEDAVERYPGTVLLVSHDRALLRALATRVWVLHEQRITTFDGSFAEWEVVSAERAHAASVAAAEEESLRRVREHRRTERPDADADRDRSALRTARRDGGRRRGRAVTAAESTVATLAAGPWRPRAVHHERRHQRGAPHSAPRSSGRGDPRCRARSVERRDGRRGASSGGRGADRRANGRPRVYVARSGASAEANVDRLTGPSSSLSGHAT